MMFQPMTSSPLHQIKFSEELVKRAEKKSLFNAACGIVKQSFTALFTPAHLRFFRVSLNIVAFLQAFCNAVQQKTLKTKL